MKTSKIKIRPWKPIKEDKREPFAVLKYGNVTIELDYTIMRMVEFNAGHIWTKTSCIANAALNEVIKEMEANIYDRLPSNHRDAMKNYTVLCAGIALIFFQIITPTSATLVRSVKPLFLKSMESLFRRLRSFLT